MLNRVILIGRLTRDPDSKYTTSGIAYCRFRLAVDRLTKNPETGEKETDFIDIVGWRKTAEFVTSYITKGRLVSVEGRLQVNNFTGNDGVRKTFYEVVADNIQTLDRARDSSAEPGQINQGGGNSVSDPVPPDDDDPFSDE
jgi:single-strand DNA-binding protein